MEPALSEFYLSKPEPVKSCLQGLRSIILSFDPDIKETRKYGMPCYTYQNKPFCYIWTDKKSSFPYLLIVEGRNIDHPALETGKRARMKTLTVSPKEDIDIETIHEVLSMAKAIQG